MSQSKVDELQGLTSQVEKQVVKETSALKSFLSGGFGGVSLVLAGHPLDLIKVRLQTSNQYSGTLDCMKSILKQDGARGLYRGMTAPLIGVTPIFAICFWGYGLGKQISRNLWNTEKDETLSLTQLAFAGGFSALPTTLIMAPSERIKCLLQVQQSQANSQTKFKGPLDVMKHLLKEGGVKSLFRGTGATLLRDVPGSVAYFWTYEFLKRSLSSNQTEISPLAVLFAGGMAGIANWTLAIPADVLKSRLQTAPEGTYTGVRDVFSS